jgi:hypothetical protein
MKNIVAWSQSFSQLDNEFVYIGETNTETLLDASEEVGLGIRKGNVSTHRHTFVSP